MDDVKAETKTTEKHSITITFESAADVQLHGRILADAAKDDRKAPLFLLRYLRSNYPTA